MLADLKFALRQLTKNPGFSLVAILTLALGIGSATTSFTALNTILLRPLPFIQHQERMLYFNEAIPGKNIDSTDVCYADFLVWRERTKTLGALWVYDDRTVILTGTDEPERVLGSGMSAGAFQAMGVQPAIGRNFRPEEDDPKAEPVTILGYGLWQRRFGGKGSVLGQLITLNGKPTTIIGVMPEGWRYPETADIWVPLGYNAAEARHGNFQYGGHAMLKPGVTLDEAQVEFATISAALAKEFPATNEGLVGVLRPVREEATEDVATLTKLLFGAVMFVFLIACANVANLLLARASARTREIAIRLALGAGRGRLIRQLLIESLMLSLLGGVGGLLFGLWGVDLMLAAIPVELPFWVNFGFEPVIFGFVAGLSILASVLFGLAPAWQASRPEVVDDIKDGGRSASGGVRGRRLRNLLVSAEIALALVLLVGAGLMLRSFLLLSRVTPGFEARQILTFRAGFPPSALGRDVDRPRRFFTDLLPRLAALPGVESVSATSALPGLGIGGFQNILAEGQAVPASYADTVSAMQRIISPGFFDTLHIPLLAGRCFTDIDDATHPRVAVVDEEFVRKYFPGQNAVGKRFRTGLDAPGKPPEWIEIVGVVGNVRRWVDRDQLTATFYVPPAQLTASFMSVMMRVRSDPASYAQAARAAVLATDPNLPIYNVYTFENAIARSDSVWQRKFFNWLFGAFACVALLLASIGLYGVIAYSVAQRTQEIGVRMALGAQTNDLMRMVVIQGLRLVAAGLAVGLLAAWFLTRLLAGSLYGVSSHDAVTFLVVPALLIVVALLATLIPARRATKVDPMVALRAE